MVIMIIGAVTMSCTGVSIIHLAHYFLCGNDEKSVSVPPTICADDCKSLLTQIGINHHFYKMMIELGPKYFKILCNNNNLCFSSFIISYLIQIRKL